MTRNFLTAILIAGCVISANVLADEFQVNTYTASFQRHSSLAFDGTNYLVAWESNGQDGDSYGLFGQYVAADGTLIDNEFQINTYATSYQSSPEVTFDGTNYLVTWYGAGDGDDYGIYGQRISTAGSNLGTEFKINTYTPSLQQFPKNAFDGTNYMVTWTSYEHDGSLTGVYGQRVGTDGSLVGNEFQINTYTEGFQGYQSVSYGDSNYLVTWMSSQEGSSNGIYGRCIGTDGVMQTAEFQINTYTTSNQSWSEIAFDGTNYLVAWQGRGEDDYEGIFAQFVASDGTLVGDELQVNTYTDDTQSTPELVFDGTNYLIVWESNTQDGDGYGIFAQRIGTDGSLIGDEFQINTYTESNQQYSELAFDGTNFFVTWSSLRQDGDNYGIYADFVAGSSSSLTVPEPATIILFALGLLGAIRKYFR